MKQQIQADFAKKTVSSIEKKLKAREIDVLFVIDGGGHKNPLADFESAIIDEINQNTYCAIQQITDMILEKYGIYEK